MKIDSLGPLRTQRGLFCGKKCGRGCTRTEYNAATKAAYRLARQLGPGWTFHVWENLGWYYNVISPSKRIRISSSGFASYDVGNRQLATANADTPKKAYAVIIAALKEQHQQLTRALDQEGHQTERRQPGGSTRPVARDSVQHHDRRKKGA